MRKRLAENAAMKNASKKYEGKREEMVRSQIEARGIREPGVLSAFRQVPRHLFVSEALRDQAYGDYPLPIGEQQTISQPYIVAEIPRRWNSAKMTGFLRLAPARVIRLPSLPK